jgi:hypothetical protein
MHALKPDPDSEEDDEVFLRASFFRKRIGTYSQQHHGAVAIAGSERKPTMLSVWKRPGDYDRKIEARGDGGGRVLYGDLRKSETGGAFYAQLVFTVELLQLSTGGGRFGIARTSCCATCIHVANPA